MTDSSSLKNCEIEPPHTPHTPPTHTYTHTSRNDIYKSQQQVRRKFRGEKITGRIPAEALQPKHPLCRLCMALAWSSHQEGCNVLKRDYRFYFFHVYLFAASSEVDLAQFECLKYMKDS